MLGASLEEVIAFRARLEVVMFVWLVSLHGADVDRGKEAFAFVVVPLGRVPYDCISDGADDCRAVIIAVAIFVACYVVSISVDVKLVSRECVRPPIQEFRE